MLTHITQITPTIQTGAGTHPVCGFFCFYTCKWSELHAISLGNCRSNKGSLHACRQDLSYCRYLELGVISHTLCKAQYPLSCSCYCAIIQSKQSLAQYMQSGAEMHSIVFTNCITRGWLWRTGVVFHKKRYLVGSSTSNQFHFFILNTKVSTMMLSPLHRNLSLHCTLSLTNRFLSLSMDLPKAHQSDVGSLN